ncbi:MAG: efflux RND transporter periplasmic adaptor subunit, partial [Planctomycetota bacterium]
VGTVDYDETKVRDVNIKVSGWIEKLYLDFLGAEVQAGEPLFELYAPDLFEAQEEYLLEYRRRRAAKPGDLPGLPGSDIDLLEAARTRLEYYDISPEQIRALERSGVPSKTMTIHSPHEGIVIAKHANEGMRVDLGMQVYRIADLSKIWVMVTLYEYQLPYVEVGQSAVMSLPYIPGQTFEGKVIYVYPYLDKKTRQVNVRLEFDNPTLLLKPGMYANVELSSTLARERTLVPRAAIIDTGERQVAFVSLGEGKFDPRELQTGVETVSGMVEILDGLKPGEMVVTSGQFLLDSEAKMRESLAKMIRGTMAAEQEAAVAVAGASELSALPAEVETMLSGILRAYFAIGDTLAGDSTAGIAARAREIAAGVDRLLEVEIPEDPHFWHKHDEVATVRGKAIELTDVSDLEEARLMFADLSVALTKVARATGVPPSYGTEVHELHCPMFRAGQGGSIWLQPKGDVRNPFFGSIMLECFDERSTLPFTGGAAGELGPTPAPAAPADVDPDRRDLDEPVGESVQRQVDRLVDAYFALHEMLTRDESAGASEPLQRIHDSASGLAASGHTPLVEPAGRIAETAAQRPGDLDALRAAFEEVSEALIEVVRAAPPSEAVSPAVHHVYCPMVKKRWLQPSKEVANPYAPSMLRCGRVEQTIAAR